MFCFLIVSSDLLNSRTKPASFLYHVMSNIETGYYMRVEKEQNAIKLLKEMFLFFIPPHPFFFFYRVQKPSPSEGTLPLSPLSVFPQDIQIKEKEKETVLCSFQTQVFSLEVLSLFSAVCTETQNPFRSEAPGLRGSFGGIK
ncbi:hypothetical protein CEXT_777901 [Caerostris extrusa]|uniref:Uncharacterized protein n=1 Tax=Caerostris extrusa TaxID=172846 RepID=A0AAV4R363_CAEEX|nr:hypothetical protein CEXT_777901 [Caerostris extrusa]